MCCLSQEKARKSWSTAIFFSLEASFCDLSLNTRTISASELLGYLVLCWYKPAIQLCHLPTCSVLVAGTTDDTTNSKVHSMYSDGLLALSAREENPRLEGDIKASKNWGGFRISFSSYFSFSSFSFPIPFFAPREAHHRLPFLFLRFFFFFFFFFSSSSSILTRTSSLPALAS